jgi:murein DD-endopeptidase MepM/ murein hydrolase activator NlpD
MLRASYVLVLFACAVSAGCQTTGGIIPKGAKLSICNDFNSTINCGGGNYSVTLPGVGVLRSHRGIDFDAPHGTPVISSTYGTVVTTGRVDCGGGYVKVETDITHMYRHSNPLLDKMTSPIHATYFHIVPNKALAVHATVKPGDLIGHIDSVNNIRSCSTITDHVHIEFSILGDPKNVVNPHEYWMDGPQKVTCYRDGMVVPKGKTVAPLRCE